MNKLQKAYKLYKNASCDVNITFNEYKKFLLNYKNELEIENTDLKKQLKEKDEKIEELEAHIEDIESHIDELLYRDN